MRLADHKHAIRTCNRQYPMAANYKNANRGSFSKNCASLKISGIEHIENSVRGGNRLKRLLQRVSYWIYTLKAIIYPGLNWVLDPSPFFKLNFSILVIEYQDHCYVLSFSERWWFLSPLLRCTYSIYKVCFFCFLFFSVINCEQSFLTFFCHWQVVLIKSCNRPPVHIEYLRENWAVRQTFLSSSWRRLVWLKCVAMF